MHVNIFSHIGIGMPKTVGYILQRDAGFSQERRMGVPERVRSYDPPDGLQRQLPEIYSVGVVAYAVGWMGGAATIGKGILIAVIHLGLAFVIWFLFMRYYRAEAKKMNDRIQAMK